MLIIIAVLSCFLLYFFIPEEKKDSISSLEGVTLTAVNGQQFRLAGQFTEKPILLVFWSTTCGSCIEEIPFISKLHESLKDKITIIGIHPNFPIKKVQKFIKKYKPAIPYMIAVDTQEILSKTYNVSILPRTLLIDRNGKVLYDHTGYAPENEKDVTNAISSIALN
ncbi:MAG: TlpA family protein disulfide reductase [Candidatus Riflebacteria bacterium]|nr:TlpA family protein disulfide reductase [Candidatus Riflebacteria bacterium]